MNPGDLLMIQADQVELCLDFVQKWLARPLGQSWSVDEIAVEQRIEVPLSCID